MGPNATNDAALGRSRSICTTATSNHAAVGADIVESASQETRGWGNQLAFMFPWECRRAESSWFVAGSAAWLRKGYRCNSDKFRKDVRRTIHHQMPDGSTRDDIYGSASSHYTADVGHIFSLENGGSNTLGNIFMQETRFNRSIKNHQDELNAALVGLERTKIALEESRRFGSIHKGKWASLSAEDIHALGRGQFKQVGVLTRKSGGIDARCAAVRRGDLTISPHGMVLGLKEKADEIRRRQARTHVKGEAQLGQFTHLTARKAAGEPRNKCSGAFEAHSRPPQSGLEFLRWWVAVLLTKKW